jgi:hypothetical protein
MYIYIYNIYILVSLLPSLFSLPPSEYQDYLVSDDDAAMLCCSMHIYIYYICICIFVCLYIYIYIYI